MAAVTDGPDDRPGFTVQDAISILRRRWLWIAGPLILLGALGSALAMILPPVYVSTGLIAIETQEIRSDLVRTTVTGGATQRIRAIEQRIMTRDNLLEMANRLNVFADRPPMSPSEIVDAMREKSSFRSQGVSQGRRGPVIVTGVAISFESARPQIASRVANEIITQVLSLNVAQRQSSASGTLEFFDQEVARLDRELRQIEEAITAFKAENQDALPESLAFRRGELSSTQQRLLENTTRLTGFEQQRRRIEEVLESGGSLSVASADLTPEQREAERLRRVLVQQRAIYADSHPSIRSLVARIEALDASAPALADDGVEGEAPSLRGQQVLAAINAEIEGIQERIARDEERIAALEASIRMTPQVEIELGNLLRERNTLQGRYDRATARRGEAEIGERLEVSQRAERFELIEQAITPSTPISPNRPLIMAAGFAGGGAVGGVLMLLVEFLNRRLRTSRDLERSLGLRPIVTVPRIWTVREVARRRMLRRIVVIGALVILPVSLYLVDQYYSPLPLVAESIMRTLKIDQFIALIERRFGN